MEYYKLEETIIKKIIVLFLLITLANVANAANVSLGVGYGKEKINSTLTVDLIRAQTITRLNNGVLLGGNIQKGYANSKNVPDETRVEGLVGYSAKIQSLPTYALFSYGHRDRKFTNYNYYAIQIGTQYNIVDNFYTTVAYRFRDTNKATWQTNTYFLGTGINLSRTVSIDLTYGYTTGTFDSDSLSIAIINRF